MEASDCRVRLRASRTATQEQHVADHEVLSDVLASRAGNSAHRPGRDLWRRKSAISAISTAWCAATRTARFASPRKSLPCPFPEKHENPSNFGSGRQKTSGLTRSQLRVSPEASCGSDPKPVAGETRNSLRVRPEANCEHLEDEVKGLSIQRGEAPPADDKELAFRTWEKRVADMRNSDLRKLEEVVAREFRDAKSETARDLAKRKLVTIRLQLRGPVAEDKPAAKPVRTDKPKPAAIPLAKRQEIWGRAKTEAGL